MMNTESIKKLLMTRIFNVNGKEVLIPIYAGEKYLVSPPNPRKLKHRGRICEVIGWDKDRPKYPGFVVRFQDNNRQGKVETDDLVPVDITESLLIEISKTKTSHTASYRCV